MWSSLVWTWVHSASNPLRVGISTERTRRPFRLVARSHQSWVGLFWKCLLCQPFSKWYNCWGKQNFWVAIRRRHLLYKVRETSKFGHKCSNAPQFVYNATATCRYICLCLSAVVPTLVKLFVLLEIHTYHREEDVSLRIRYKEISVQIKCKNSVHMFSGTWKWV